MTEVKLSNVISLVVFIFLCCGAKVLNSRKAECVNESLKTYRSALYSNSPLNCGDYYFKFIKMERQKPKIEETMWCFHCDKEWHTDDYYNCKSCPNCTTEPKRIYRTSSFTFVYAYLEKHPDKKPNNDKLS